MKRTDRIWGIFCVCLTGYFVAGFLSIQFINPVTATDEIRTDLEVIDVDVTAYSPSSHITNSDPFTMASGRRARPQELEQLRFVAVSRDLMEEYGLEYGDTVWIGFTLEDTMNKRIKNTVDLFMRNLDLARRFGRQKRQIIIRRKE